MANEALRALQQGHPPFLRAVWADARITAQLRFERSEFTSRLDGVVQILRLMWVSDAFAAQVMYRGKARLQQLRVPVLPRVLHRLAMMHSQVCIGDPVIVEPGIYIAHGQVVIDGLTRVSTGTVLFPWVTLGLKSGVLQGPTVLAHSSIGTGAKLIGPITVGPHASVGANSVVVDDVPEGVTVVGVPARPL
jgi:serine O-acetyltransferase